MGGNKAVEGGEGQGKACLPAMREDFTLIVANRKAEQGWTDADAEELGRYIAEAKANPEAFDAWRLYLATEAAVIRQRKAPGRK